VNAQFSPLCIRFGKKYGGYLEGGYGYKGVVNTGVYYSFR